MENCARLGFADTRGSESKEVGRRSGGCRGQGTGPSQSKTEDPVFRPGPRPHTKRAGTRSGTHLEPCNLPILSTYQSIPEQKRTEQKNFWFCSVLIRARAEQSLLCSFARILADKPDNYILS